MIKNFSCQNYRNIHVQGVEFSRINLLIGPNNSGKSNFIKAVSFASDMLMNAERGNLNSAFMNSISRNGWNHILYNQAKDSAVSMVWDVDLKDKSLRYSFSFVPGDTVENCSILLEELNSLDKNNRYENPFNFFRCHSPKVGKGTFSAAVKTGKKNKRLSFDIDSKETIIKQFKDILLGDKGIYGSEMIRVDIATLLYELETYFKGFSVHASPRFNSALIREPVNSRSIDSLLASDGRNFVNVFNNCKARDPQWKLLFEEKMKELIPSLKSVDTSVVYDKLIFQMIFDSAAYDLSDVSEGTIKGLLLNLLINPPAGANSSLLAIDEPESNLHPAWQKVVGNWLQTSEQYTQCFISTHSPDFLDAFTEEFKIGNVAVFVFKGGGSIKKIRFEDIVDDLGDWELGDLYRTNDPALGGWPW